jgi:hypothetical protein
MTQDTKEVNNKVNDQAIYSSENTIRISPKANKGSEKRVASKDVHSSENVKDGNRSNDSETCFIANTFDDFEAAYKASIAHLNKLRKDKFLSKRNLKNIRLLMQYYFDHMNAITSDGKPWRVYDSHIVSSLSEFGFNLCTLKSTLKKLRAAGYISVQLFMETVTRPSLHGNRELKFKIPRPKRFFSITPIFNDFDGDPGKRVLFPGAHSIFIILPKNKRKTVKQ